MARSYAGDARHGVTELVCLDASTHLTADLLDIVSAHAKTLVAAELVLLAVIAIVVWEPVLRGMRADWARTLHAS